MSDDASKPSTNSDPRTHGLDAIFNPGSIAVIGASSNKLKIGGRPLHHLISYGYEGNVYPINPQHDVVQGVPAYPSLESLPEVPDLAIVAVPGGAVLKAVRECAEHGVKAVVLFSAGFAEIGEAGRRAQAELAMIAEESGMRIVGPNCIGAARMSTGVTPTFAAAIMLPRERPIRDVPHIALVSQSGAIGGHLVALAPDRGFEFDPWITTGNESDVDTADAIAYFAEQDYVSAIAVYIEGSSNGEALRKALSLARRAGKPIIILKSGVSEVGASAVASHTASLVGSDDVYDALFLQYGATRVHSVRDLLDTSYLLATGKVPAGSRVGLLTGSGGAGILMADAAAATALDVSPLPETVQAQLKKLWPPAGVANPIDMTAQVTNDPDLFASFLEAVITGAEYDTLLIWLSYLGMIEPWAGTITEALRRVRAAHPEANIIVSSMTNADSAQAFREMNIPVFDELSDMIQTAARMVRIGEMLRAPLADELIPAAGLPVIDPSATLTEDQAKLVLTEVGIPTVPDRLVTSASAARQAAEEFGYPVVLKIVSVDLPHKSEVGGVVLSIQDGDAVEAAYGRIMTGVSAAAPEARISGIIVAPMIAGGVETILGIKNDPALGMTVAVGLGGVFVEVLQDVVLRLAPFDIATAMEMIRELRGFELLDGARGTEPADINALANALSALSHFAAANASTIESIDINPFVVLPHGRGAYALDAFISPLSAQPH